MQVQTIDVVSQILEAKRRKVRLWPVRSNRASELGHPCLRYLVYLRTAWDKRTLHSPELQMIFDEGNRQEEAVLEDLREAGFQVVEQQRPFEWKEYQITGHIDGKILWEGEAVPFEIKSMSPYIFSEIQSFEDMKNSKHWWVRKYPAQMMLYLLMDEKEYGIFLLKNKSSGQIKQIDVVLDYEFGEALIKKAEQVNKYVEEKTLPDTAFDIELCPECPFKHLCDVAMNWEKGVEFVEDAELEELLKQWEFLKPFAKEYDQVDKKIKKMVEGKEKLCVGPFLITGKWVEKNMKPQPARTIRFWQKKITRI